MKFYIVAVPENEDGSEAMKHAQPLAIIYGATAQAATFKAIREAKAKLSEKNPDLGAMIQFGVSFGSAQDRASMYEQAAREAAAAKAAEAQTERSIEGILSFVK